MSVHRIVEVLSWKVKSPVYEGIGTAESKVLIAAYLFSLRIKLGDRSSIKVSGLL